jgi:hypothetical protein
MEEILPGHSRYLFIAGGKPDLGSVALVYSRGLRTLLVAGIIDLPLPSSI